MKIQSGRELFKSYTKALCILYPHEEAVSIVQLLFAHFLDMERKDILLDRKVAEIPAGMEEALTLLLGGNPIQYILGKASFYGRDYYVTPEVLIPRFETEELVHLILRETAMSAPNILDIGTGSGCIPITLSLEISQSRVMGLDISPEALEIAIRNANNLNATLDFLLIDVLHDELPTGPWDIIVSNPPYVRDLEKKEMHQNVLAHEPPLALFVPDNDPLLFYRIIAKKAAKNLNPGGRLYFEINEAFGNETKQVVERAGFSEIGIHVDLQGKDRIISATWLG
jgi:release factor glutamine methyltransferase